MSEREVLAALTAIESVDLAAPVYRTARRLLDLAAQRHGHVRIAPPAMRQLAGTNADGTMRRHLIELSNAGIIHYSINGDVWVSFTAWPAEIAWPVAEITPRAQEITNPNEGSAQPAREDTSEKIIQRAPEITVRAPEIISTTPQHEPEPKAGNKNDPARAPDARSDAKNDLTRAPDDHDLIRAQLVGGLVDPSIPEKVEPPTPQPPKAPPVNERVVDLLIAVGISPGKARELAALCSLPEALRQIAAWTPDYDAGRVQIGALITRIEKRWAAPEISAAFRQTPLYREFAPRDVEFYLEGIPAGSLPTARDTTSQSDPPQPTPPAVEVYEAARQDPAAAWEIVKWEARTSTLPESLWGPLQSAQLERGEDVADLPLYRVVLPPDADRATLERRLAVWMRRALGSVFQHKCLVEFVLAETEAA